MNVMLLASNAITLMQLNMIIYCLCIYKCLSKMNLLLYVLYYIYKHCGHALSLASTDCYKCPHFSVYYCPCSIYTSCNLLSYHICSITAPLFVLILNLICFLWIVIGHCLNTVPLYTWRNFPYSVAFWMHII